MQIGMVALIWQYATDDDQFTVYIPNDVQILCTRFVAAMMMHLQVEKDIRNGLTMMKYAVNHYSNF